MSIEQIKKGAFDRIFKSWKSSLVAVVVMAVCFWLVYAEKASILEAIIGGALPVLYFLFINDKPKNT